MRTNIIAGPQSDIILEQNVPNPFVDKTKVSFSIPANAEVAFEIIDNNGKLIQRLVNLYDAGAHEIIFNGHELKPGVYFYTMKVGETMLTRSMIVVE